jgi:hypothetical protein
MYFNTKSYLKSTHNHTAKHAHPSMPSWLIILILIRSSFACIDKLLLLLLAITRDCLLEGLNNLYVSRKKKHFIV